MKLWNREGKGWLQSGLVFVLLGWVSIAVAGPLEDLRGVSALEGVTAAGLLRGEVYNARGTQGNFSRGAYAEVCYYIKASPATVAATLMHWDPSRYKETQVSAYQTYSWPAGPDVFKKFQLSASRSDDHQLLEWSRAAAHGEKGNLYIGRAEHEILRRQLAAGGAQDVQISTAWQAILRGRDAAVASGGYPAMPSFPISGGNLRAADEYRSLLKMTPAIAAKFAALTGAKPIFPDGATTADEVVPYAEQSDVNGHTSFCLGTFAARKAPDASWQVVDCSYYTVDTYFMSLALYQFWPWENGTLVWEVDYVSAPFRSYLGGVDRVIAGKQLSKESSQGVHLFRRVAEGKGR